MHCSSVMTHSSKPSVCTVGPILTETCSILGQHGTRCGASLYRLPADKAYHAYKSTDDKCANWKTMANDSKGHSGGQCHLITTDISM